MSIEKITSKIVSDAEADAAAVRNEAKAQCDVILREAEAKAEAIVQKAQKQGREEKAKRISRRKAVAEIDGRKLLLSEKQKLIAECFDRAADRISSMAAEEYTAFLARLVKGTGQTGGELILNRRDAEAIGPALVSAVAEAVPGSRIVLSEETRDIKGGFLLKQGAVYINGTIEALMEEAREDLAGEVAEQLFQ